MSSLRRRLFPALTLALPLLSSCNNSEPDYRLPPPVEDPPEVQVGERLFLETRFAQYFFAHTGGDVNTPLIGGDPVMQTSETAGAPLPGPFAGASMNCRACHLVDELGETPGGGVRTYSDFARRSPVPAREDGVLVTTRNAPALVDASLPRPIGELLHFDGEFNSVESLVTGTLTGRNFGWLPQEQGVAVAHIARVIRQDDGRGELAAEFGALPYRILLAATDSRIPNELRLPPDFRVQVDQVDDAEVVAAASNLIGAYVRSLIFIQDSAGNFVNSPYDLFLKKNHLPRQPDPGESDADYSRRLIAAVDALTNPSFVAPNEATFRLHRQPFRFGPDELQGMRIFFAEASSAAGLPSGGPGNCIACHPAPTFTDFAFHNTGITQREYDEVHGTGTFSALDVPDLATRHADPDAYLPPSAAHPHANGRFRSPASVEQPGYTDLGGWNVLGNPDIPEPQDALLETLCATLGVDGAECTPAAMLPFSIAVFKTPGLRDLGQATPFMHNGSLDRIEDVLDHYVVFSELAREGDVRNASPQLLGVTLQPTDLAPLAAFLRALNEDYD